MTDPIQPDPMDSKTPAVSSDAEQPKKVELPEATLQIVRRELVKILTQLRTPRKAMVLIGKLHSALESLPEKDRPDRKGFTMKDLLDDGYLADGNELLWDEQTKAYSVAKLPVVPQAPATPPPAPAAKKDIVPEGWKNISEVPVAERVAIAEAIFGVMLRTRHLQPSDFSGKKLRNFLDSLSADARKNFSASLIGFGGEPGTFGALFIAEGLANPPDPKTSNSQIELRDEVVSAPSPSYAKALEIVEDAETKGSRPVRASSRALLYEAMHPAQAAAWQRLMTSGARELRPDPLQLGAALGFTPTTAADRKKLFTKAEYDAIDAFKREMLENGLLRPMSSQGRGGRPDSRVEFAVEPLQSLSYAAALTEMIWRRNTNAPYENIGAEERLRQNANALAPHMNRFAAAIETLTKTKAAGAATLDAEQAAALAAREELRTAYIPLEQLWESIADRQLRGSLERSIMEPIRNQCLDLDARYTRAARKKEREPQAAPGKPAGSTGAAPLKSAVIEEVVSTPATEAPAMLNTSTGGISSERAPVSFDLGQRRRTELHASKEKALAMFEQGNMEGVYSYLRSLPKSSPKYRALADACYYYDSAVARLSWPEMTPPSPQLDANIAMLEARVAALNQRIKRVNTVLTTISEKDADLLSGLERLHKKQGMEKIPLIGRLFEPKYVKRARQIIEQKASAEAEGSERSLTALAWVTRHKWSAQSKQANILSEKDSLERSLRQLQEIKARAAEYAPERERELAVIREQRRRIPLLLNS